ncbi:MAG TPA: hypothetical protein VJ952_10890 [Opitutales bacterium]|nr:hypothetical protein [Opitutales bacterium]
MQKHYLILPLLLALLLSACKKDKIEAEDMKIPRLMVETRGVQYGGLGGQVVQLPVSGTRIALQKEPLVTEFDIVNVELVKVELGLALLIQTNERGARALYRGTVSNMGGRIVLTVNNNAIGARRIDSAIQNGNLYTFVEVSDDEIGQLVLDMKKTIQKLQEL